MSRALARRSQRALGIAPGARIELPASQAIDLMQSQYVRLTRIGKGLADKAKAEGKPVPCELIALYHAAVKEYFTLSGQIIDQMAKQGIKVGQLELDANGNPQSDPENPDNLLVRYIEAPARPPVFVTREGPCKDRPDMTHLSGMPVGLGYLGAVISVARVAGSFLVKNAKSLITWTGVLYATTKLAPSAERIALSIGSYNPLPGEKLSCVEKALDKGLSTDDAVALCKGEATGLGFWGVTGLVLGAAALVGGAVYYTLKIAPGRAAARAEREAAEMEAERLEVEARAARRRARRAGRRPSASPEYAEYEPAMAGVSDDKLAGCPCAL